MIVHIYAAWAKEAIQPAAIPRYSSKDVTVVLPTLGNDCEDFRHCLSTIHACNPHTVLIVTPSANVEGVKGVLKDLGIGNFRVLGAPKANKRLQMIQGIKSVRTPIVVFADDDVFWPTTFLTYMMAPFEDPSVGAAGPFTSLERPKEPNVWSFLNTGYLERWNFELAANSYVDGGISCLSGRTQVVRTAIVQSEEFIDYFTNETWLFDIPLIGADDDDSLTRYLVNRNWKIAIQTAPEANLTTTLEGNNKFLGQCLRWHRTVWRSNFTSMLVDRMVWKSQPWSWYTLHLSMFNFPAIIYDPLLVFLLVRSYEDGKPLPFFPNSLTAAMAILIIWILSAKTVKLVHHFRRYPADLKYLPQMWGFCYLNIYVKYGSLLTLYKTTWDGGRASLAEQLSASATAVMNTAMGTKNVATASGKFLAVNAKLAAIESSKYVAANATDAIPRLVRSLPDSPLKKFGSEPDLSRLSAKLKSFGSGTDLNRSDSPLRTLSSVADKECKDMQPELRHISIKSDSF